MKIQIQIQKQEFKANDIANISSPELSVSQLRLYRNLRLYHRNLHILLNDSPNPLQLQFTAESPTVVQTI